MTEKLNYPKNRWLMLILTCLITICTGSIYAWSVFATPMAEYLTEVTGTQITSLSIVFTIGNSIGPVFMISSGFINDKIGTRPVLFAGAVLFGAGMIFSGLAKSTGTLILAYGIGVGSVIGLPHGIPASNVLKYNPDKAVLAGGTTTASSGISSVIVSPIAESLIRNLSVNAAFIIIGSVMAVLLLVCTFLIKPCPAEFLNEVSAAKSPDAGNSSFDKNWKEMLKTPYFYIMLLMLFCGSFSGLMITSQASSISQNMIGLSTTTAAVIVSVLALFNTAGRVLSGFISDRIGPVKTLRITSALLIVGQLLLFASANGSFAVFVAGISIVGYCFGSIMGIYPGFTASRFGSKNNSVNYGIMFCGFAISGYFGPMVLNSIFNSTGTYTPAFLIAAGLAACGVGLTFVTLKTRAH